MDWKKQATTIIKVELAKQNIDYSELSKKMENIGIEEDKSNIANKLSRGTFSFAYALQIFKALGLKKLNLEDM